MNTPQKILLGITAGIAAYKTPDLIRRLKEKGARIKVVLTKNAQEFVTPLTLQAVSGEEVRTDLWDLEAENAMGHIELARFPDQILIAPASADFIARLVQGKADDLLTTLCLATDAPIFIAPSMNRLMWENKATQTNIQTLKDRGITVIPPATGEQACGEFGEGRLPDIEELVEFLGLAQTKALAGKNVLITAGPTIEPIDPVRFISNHSSGKMGYALAQAASLMGAHVTLISGPVHLTSPAKVTVIKVKTAQEMYAAVMENLSAQDIFIGAAAVADYSPVQVSEQKVPKDLQTMTLNLKPTPDILASVKQQKPKIFAVGFAAQTHAIIAKAREKLVQKQLDMICANDVSRTDIGFHSDDNALTLLTQDKQIPLAVMRKSILAQQVMLYVVEFMNAKNSA